MPVVERGRLPFGDGTINDYIYRNAAGVNSNMIQALVKQSAESMVTDTLLPLIGPLDHQCERDYLQRLQDVSNTWRATNEAEGGELFHTLATFSPLAADVMGLAKGDDKQRWKQDQDIIRVMYLLFPREEILQGLSSFRSVLAEQEEASLTGIRRSISALHTIIFILRDDDLTRRPEERARMIAVLTPFVSSPVLSNEARTEIAELVVQASPEVGHDQEVSIDFWWRALESTASGISGRAIRRIACIIDTHQAESIADIERLVTETGITDENYSTWMNFSKAVESLSILPGQETDGIFQILVQKILAIERHPETRYRFGLADVCKTINTLLYYAHFRGRTVELIEEREQLLFVDKLLDLYIPIKHDMNIRGPILNLLFTVLVRTYPNLSFGKKITEKIRAAVDNLQLIHGPPEDVPLDLIGELLRRKLEVEDHSEFFGV